MRVVKFLRVTATFSYFSLKNRHNLLLVKIRQGKLSIFGTYLDVCKPKFDASELAAWSSAGYKFQRIVYDYRYFNSIGILILFSNTDIHRTL